MKALSFILVLIPTIIFADGGIAGSYRSIPAYIKDMDGKKIGKTRFQKLFHLSFLINLLIFYQD